MSRSVPYGVRTLIVMAALAVPIAACGPANELQTSPVKEGVQTKVTFTVWPEGARGDSDEKELDCRDVDRDDTERKALCDALESVPAEAIRGTSAGTPCSSVIFGNATARITGTYDGRPLDSGLRLTNGCEIARWRALSRFIGDPNPGGRGVGISF